MDPHDVQPVGALVKGVSKREAREAWAESSQTNLLYVAMAMDARPTIAQVAEPLEAAEQLRRAALAVAADRFRKAARKR